MSPHDLSAGTLRRAPGGWASGRRAALWIGALVALSFTWCPLGASGEGTAQLGANQDLADATEIEVDIIKVGEVINIAVGNDSSLDTSAVQVSVKDPDGKPVQGSPFSVVPGKPGFLDKPGAVPTAIANPLQIVTTAAGTYSVTLDNTRTDMGASPYMNVVDPFDITVTPDAATPVDPSQPPGGFGRVHSKRWQVNGHGWGKDASSDASYYVLVPTSQGADFTWLLQFNGLAGWQYDVVGNEQGMPPPNASRSIERFVTAATCPDGYSRVTGSNCIAKPPVAQYDVYLNVPEVARGGSQAPAISGFKHVGVAPYYDCSVPELESSFSFVSDSAGTFKLVIDLNRDGKFDPQDDLLFSGAAKAAVNTVKWKGLDAEGKPLAVGSYKARLSVRVGEFHFLGNDIETANPGLRIFSVDPPDPATTPGAARMHWNDALINDRTLKIVPGVTPPEGLSSGAPTDQAICSTPGAVNAHCWGNFTTDPKQSPGDERFIDTWVFFKETVALTTLCAGEERELLAIGGGGGCATGSSGVMRWSPPLLLLSVLLLTFLLLVVSGRRRCSASDRR